MDWGDIRWVHALSLRSPMAMVSIVRFILLNDGGDGCLICDLREGSGTTLVDQM